MQRTFSVSATLASTFGFFGHNFGAILLRTWLAAVLGCLAFYLFMTVYLGQLELFLVSPTESRASILLAVVAVAVLGFLFIATLILASVSDLAFGAAPRRAPLSFGPPECRLYAAIVRFALVLSVLGILGCVIVMLLNRYFPDLRGIGGAVLVLGLLALWLRLGYLLPAVAMATSKGNVLRQSWSLSRGLALRILAVAAALMLPGLALELAGEFLGRLAHIFPAGVGAGTIESHILLFDKIVPAFAVLFSVSVLLILILNAIASVTIHRALLQGSPVRDDHAG